MSDPSSWFSLVGLVDICTSTIKPPPPLPALATAVREARTVLPETSMAVRLNGEQVEVLCDTDKDLSPLLPALMSPTLSCEKDSRVLQVLSWPKAAIASDYPAVAPALAALEQLLHLLPLVRSRILVPSVSGELEAVRFDSDRLRVAPAPDWQTVLDAALLEEIRRAPPTDPKRKYQADYRMQRVNALLELGASPNVAHPETKETPAHYAVLHGEETLLKTLLKRGANPGLKNRFGQTAAHYAALLHRDLKLGSHLPDELQFVKDDWGRTPKNLAEAIHGQNTADRARAPARRMRQPAAMTEDHHLPAGPQAVAPATSARANVLDAAPARARSSDSPGRACSLT